jgi:hypothetical protein
MHMDVDADTGLPAGNAKGQVGAFRANAAKRKQDTRVARKLSVMFGDNAAANLVNLPCLGFVESASSDSLINSFRCEPAYFRGCAGNFEQPTGGRNRNFIAGTN